MEWTMSDSQRRQRTECVKCGGEMQAGKCVNCGWWPYDFWAEWGDAIGGLVGFVLVIAFVTAIVVAVVKLLW